jgi:tetratricopeptide (TPR) repeat protein
MTPSSEFVSRILKKRCAQDPTLSSNATLMARISRDALRDPEAYATDDEDRAFAELQPAINTIRRELEEMDEEIDDFDEHAEAPKLTESIAALNRCLDLDPHCYDAQLLLILAQAVDDDVAISQLVTIEGEARAWCEERSRLYDGQTADLWDATFMRPYLRIQSKIIDLLTLSCRYRAALERSLRMLDASPADGQGIRHGTALLLARLEDEEGLDALDAAFNRVGSAWMQIARAILLYKLGRMDAARRATAGLATLYPAAAYYLVNPDVAPFYLPDRPPFAPGSDQECLFAVYEADYLAVDTPDYVDWALKIPAFSQAVNGYESSHEDDF